MKDVLTYGGAVEDLYEKMYIEAGNNPNFEKQVKSKLYKFPSALIIQDLIAKKLIAGKSNNEVYELYNFIASELHIPILTKFDLPKVLSRYYGFELYNVKRNKKKIRIYTCKGFSFKEFCSSVVVEQYLNSKKEDDIENQVTKSVYKKYLEFCEKEKYKPISNIEFSRQVTRHFDFVIKDKKIQGKKYRIFVKEGSR